MAIVTVISCLLFLVTGYAYWTNQTRVHPSASNEPTPSVDMEKPDSSGTDEIGKEEQKEIFREQIVNTIQNWPEKAKEDFLTSFDNEVPFKMAIVGSTSLGGNSGWAQMLKDSLLETFGETLVHIEIFEYEILSSEFIESEAMNEVVSFEPKLVLYEPFILNDNGYLPIETNLANIETFIEAIGNATVILQPSRPVPNGINYPREVEQLKQFAEEQGIPYLNHWEAWPEGDELEEYIISGEISPSPKGHHVWFEYLRDYFIADE